MSSGDFTREERSFLESLPRLATANPFLPERIELEREILGGDFEDVSPVWSKRLDRENPNLTRIAARAEDVAKSLRPRLADSGALSSGDGRLYEELAFYLLYYRFEEDFGRAMSEPSVRFYDAFCREALKLLPAGD